MQFGNGLTGSVVGGLYGGGGSPGSAGQAAAPAASSPPTGRASLMAAAWGTDDGGQSRAGNVAAWVAAASWAGLIYLWWVLPK